MDKTKIAIIGLGNRGRDTYLPILEAETERAEIVAVADIVPEKLQEAGDRLGLPDAMRFASGEALLAADKLADAVLICTQDRQHVGHAIPALEKGYDVLLEKPISPDLDECRKLVEVAKRTGRKVVVCHVLRYTPFYRALKKLLDDGAIGEIVSIQAREDVGYWHQAHSFVRGNWRNDEESSPMILQKCCHDMDLYLWLANRHAVRVSSVGNTFHFKASCAPEGAAMRCLDGCAAKASCPYDAEKIYITSPRTGIEHGHDGWPNEVLTLHPTKETVYEAIRTGPYGRCVYHCDNNVVDHQVLSVELEHGESFSFTMCAFTEHNNRAAEIKGTKGDLTANLLTGTIEVRPFGGEAYTVEPNLHEDDIKGHAGGDARLISAFLGYLRDEPGDRSSITSLEASTESHYLALAAEQSRRDHGRMVELSEVRG